MRKPAYVLASRLLLLFSFALCPVPSAADARNPQATVLYFTDAHQLAPVVDRLGERGGVSRLATVIQKVRREAPVRW